MKVKIKRIDKDLPLPTYGTPAAAAVDLYSRVDMKIAAQSIGFVPANVIVCAPPGHAFIIVPRSSTPARKGLSIPHGIGIVDSDYCGPEDEIKMQFFNFTDKEVEIKRGDRIGQGFFMPVEKIEWEELDELAGTSRGGYGSTGV